MTTKFEYKRDDSKDELVDTDVYKQEAYSSWEISV